MVRKETLSGRHGGKTDFRTIAAGILECLANIASKEEVVRALNITPSTLKEWTYSRTIPSTKLNGKRVYVKTFLVEWLATKLEKESVHAGN